MRGRPGTAAASHPRTQPRRRRRRPRRAAAIVSRLPAGRCGTRICSSCGGFLRRFGIRLSSSGSRRPAPHRLSVRLGHRLGGAAGLADGRARCRLGLLGLLRFCDLIRGAETASGSDAFVRRRNRPHRRRGVAGSASATSATSVGLGVSVFSSAAVVVGVAHGSPQAPCAAASDGGDGQPGVGRSRSASRERRFSVGGQIT